MKKIKKFKKVLSLLLAVIMLVSAFSVGASAAATRLTAGTSMASATSIPEYSKNYVSTLSVPKGTNWFKFKTLSSDAYYTISLLNINIPTSGSYDQNLDLQLYLYDSNSIQMGYIFSSMNTTSSCNIKLENNETYYLKIKMGSWNEKATGDYQINISYKLDEVKNEKSNATLVQLNQTYYSSIDGYRDIDWFKFNTISSDSEYTIEMLNIDIPTRNSSDKKDDLQLYLYDSNSIQKCYIYAAMNRTTSSKLKLEANKTYYLKICMGSWNERATGNYSIKINNPQYSSFTGTFKDNRGTKTVTGTKITAPSISSKSGWTSMGWTTTAGFPASVTVNANSSYTLSKNTTFYALYKKNLTLSYNANGGNNAPSSQTQTIYYNSCRLTQTAIFNLSSKTPTRDGYSFAGWSTNPNAQTASYSAGQTFELSENSATTLYAVWQANAQPKVTFWQKIANFFISIFNWFKNLF